MEIGQVPTHVTAVMPRGWFHDCSQALILPLLGDLFPFSFKLWTGGISSSRVPIHLRVPQYGAIRTQP